MNDAMSGADSSRKPPAWSKAWAKLLPRWLMAAAGRMELDPRLFAEFERSGLTLRYLPAWQPSEKDGRRLQNADFIIQRALREPPSNLEERRQHLTAQLAGDGHWAELRQLALAYLEGELQKGPIQQAGAPPRPTPTANPMVGGLRCGIRAASSRSSSEVRRRQTQAVIEAIRGQTLRPQLLPDVNFLKDTTALTLYLDEAWSMPQNALAPNEGVIAAVLCQGPPSTRFADLPPIRTHVFAKPHQAKQALESLWSCRHCLPLILPLRLPKGIGQPACYYDQLLHHALRLICGWLLPQPTHPIDLYVLAEAIEGAGHPAGDVATDFYRGLLAADTSGRFAHWNLREVRWCDKDEGYIPYADLLGYLNHEHTELNRALGEWSGFKDLPGYVPFSLELVPRLERLEHLERSANLADVIDFALETGESRFGRLVMQDLAQRLAKRPELQLALLNTLEDAYRDKVRDLKRLRRAFAAVRGLLPELPTDASPRMRLLWYLLALQDANHDGDPGRIRAAASAYRRERERLKASERELCAEVDLNLAVHDADRFAFGHAEATIWEWIEDPLFPALSLRQQGRFYSALGQYRAMRGLALDADACFAEALKVFAQAPLSEQERAAEMEQTRIYRAINALDARLPQALELVVQALGGPIDPKLATDLASDGSIAQQYRHHLLLRAISLRPELAAARAAYLAARPYWAEGHPQHPWPGIWGHRGFLLWNQGELDGESVAAAQGCFDRAIILCALDCHGPTMRLIGGFWATVAACCFANCEYEEEARALLHQARVLSEAVPVIEALEQILQAPASEYLEMLFGVLPFNYR